MNNLRLKSLGLLSISFFLLACCHSPTRPNESLLSKARRIHSNVLTLDTHIDINTKNFTQRRHMGMALEGVQGDLTKMKEGGLDAGFFIVYVGQGERTHEAYQQALSKAMDKFDAIHRMANKLNSDRIALATSPADVRRIHQANKLVAMIGVENAYPLGADLSLVDRFYAYGARYMSLTHNGHSQFADSNYAKGADPHILYDGVSPLGEQLIAKLNRLGIMVDISHSSKKSALDMIRLSKAPVIASHSSVGALVPHSRNLDNTVLRALKKNNGVVQVTAFRSYLRKLPFEKLIAANKLADEYGLPHGDIWSSGDRIFAEFKKLSGPKRGEYFKRLRALDKNYDHGTVSDLVDHIDYVVEKIGIDHVGISSDFDGGGGIDGWADASQTFNVTFELVKRGYSEEEIAKIWSGNLLRVWSDVEKTAKEIQS